MANEKRLVNAEAISRKLKNAYCAECNVVRKIQCSACWVEDVLELLEGDTVDAVEVVHGQRIYNAHEVAEIIADLFGDSCACNFNSIDEWLPFKCELLDCCPNTYGVACWEQYLKFRDAKMDGERKDK